MEPSTRELKLACRMSGPIHRHRGLGVGDHVSPVDGHGQDSRRQAAGWVSQNQMLWRMCDQKRQDALYKDANARELVNKREESLWHRWQAHLEDPLMALEEALKRVGESEKDEPTSSHADSYSMF